MIAFFKLILYTPLLNLLIFLYNNIAFQDLGVAIILLTLIIRFVLYPLFYKSFLNQTLMQKLQPEIAKIQHEHKHDKEKQAQVLLALYREHKVNPFSSFLLLLVQLPILIALYQVFLSPPTDLSPMFLNLIDLSKTSILIVGLATVAQYIQGKLTLPKTKPNEEVPQTTKIAQQMVYIGPAITLVVLWTLPAAVGLYWLVSSVFSLGQQLYINKKIEKKYGNLKTDNPADIGKNRI
ncbi:MAG: YidC/Oxa1 family membrane protein insertase [Patescibacteria group bacterium]